MNPSAHPDPTQMALEPEQLAAWVEEVGDLQLIDVREDYEHEAGHIAGSRHLALGTLAAGVSTIDATRPVILYCRVGARSDMAAEALRGAGFEAYSVAGGLLRWAGEGRPLVPPDGAVAEH